MAHIKGMLSQAILQQVHLCIGGDCLVRQLETSKHDTTKSLTLSRGVFRRVDRESVAVAVAMAVAMAVTVVEVVAAIIIVITFIIGIIIIIIIMTTTTTTMGER
jgi:putative effector of murein hydrolase